MDNMKLIPNHQFGFRSGHSAVQQIHRVVECIGEGLERKSYCTAAFLDFCFAFDKVWHEGLLIKLKERFPTQLFNILQSYLSLRHYYVRYRQETTDLYPVHAGVPQGSILGPILYSLYTADIPVAPQTMIATYADDTVIMASHKDPERAAQWLQRGLGLIQDWLKTWRMQLNENKCVQVTYSLKKGDCPPVYLNDVQIPTSDCAKYLGLHIDKRLTWKTHILKKRMQLSEKYRKMLWLIGPKSKMSLQNKLLLYKAILKPVWTYGLELWGSASNSNIEILQRFENKYLRMITGAPWFTPNDVIRRNSDLPTVKEEIIIRMKKHKEKVAAHTNPLAQDLLIVSYEQRLKRRRVADFVSF
ncbi:hypothetical protein DMENIID0001_009250 [Sergentomyia squamirostris]